MKLLGERHPFSHAATAAAGQCYSLRRYRFFSLTLKSLAFMDLKQRLEM